MRHLSISFLFLAAIGCDNKPERAATESKAAPSASQPAVAPSVAATPSAAPSATASYAPRPERPVPKTTPTVTLKMPIETQLKAIGYMLSMRSPLPTDPPIDAEFAKEVAKLARPAVASLDHGSSGDKSKLDSVEVIGSGRELDFLVAKGCGSQMPKAVLQKIGKTLPSLFEKGVLVLRCADRDVQCFQSTRDATDVLCTYEHRN